MKQNLFAVALTLSMLQWTTAPLAAEQPTVRQGGMLINLDFLRSDDDLRSNDGGEDIPLSYEMFDETHEPAAPTPVIARSEAEAIAPVISEVTVTEISRTPVQPPPVATSLNDTPVVDTPVVVPQPLAQPEVSTPPLPVSPTPETVANRATPAAPTKLPTTTHDAPLPLPVKLVEAAAEEEEAVDPVDEAFEAIVEAMTPEAPVEPVKKNRFTFYLSDQVAFAQLETNTSRFKLDNGRLHFASIYSEERDSVIHGGISLDASFTKNFRLSFGTRAYIALLSTENVDAFAAAVGTEAAYRLPFKALPLEFSASIYYAPDILTFGAGDRAIDTQLDITMPFRSHSALFAGWRFLQFDTRPEDAEVDNRLHIGFRWDFD